MVKDIKYFRYVCKRCHGEFLSCNMVIYNKELYCEDCFKKIKDENHAVSSVIGVILILTMMFSFLPVAYLSMDKLVTTFENMIDRLTERMEAIEFKTPDYNTTGNETAYSIPEITNDDENDTAIITFVITNNDIQYAINITIPYVDFTMINESIPRIPP